MADRQDLVAVGLKGPQPDQLLELLRPGAPVAVGARERLLSQPRRMVVQLASQAVGGSCRRPTSDASTCSLRAADRTESRNSGKASVPSRSISVQSRTGASTRSRVAAR